MYLNSIAYSWMNLWWVEPLQLFVEEYNLNSCDSLWKDELNHCNPSWKSGFSLHFIYKYMSWDIWHTTLCYDIPLKLRKKGRKINSISYCLRVHESKSTKSIWREWLQVSWSLILDVLNSYNFDPIWLIQVMYVNMTHDVQFFQHQAQV